MRTDRIILLWILLLTGTGSCKKFEEKAAVKTVQYEDVTSVSATLTGKIIDEGEGIREFGFCWSNSAKPTVDDQRIKGNQSVNAGDDFEGTITGLEPGTTYYVRAYAIDRVSIVYGEVLSFTTILIQVPDLITLPVTSLTGTTAVSGGNITNDGGSPVTSKGVCWSTASGPTIELDTKTSDGAGVSQFTSNITGLQPGTNYYFRAYATNGAGTGYGNEIMLTHINTPVLTTSTVTSITTTTAVSGGNITSDGGSPVTSRGICWSTNPNPTVSLSTKTTNGTGPGSFISNMTGLQPGTPYYVRAYATNSAGTGYGTPTSFTTLPPSSIVFNPNKTYGSVTDIDGNVYKTIIIGSQTWMAENLKTTRFDNGNAIATDRYACYNNDNRNNADYGKLYRWTVIDDPRNLCPTGWHVPTDTEWRVLNEYLGSNSIAGGKMKETGTSHWDSPNTGADNESGFTGLPGGIMGSSSSFNVLGSTGFWWSSTYYPHWPEAISWSLYSSSQYLGRDEAQYIENGLSVRCILGPRIITVPNIYALSVSDYTSTSANVRAEVVAGGGAEVISRGICWSTYQNPTISSNRKASGSGTGIFSAEITGLQPGTRYYIRAYATNSAGTAYSSQEDFTTPLTVTDGSGNSYTILTIGTQTWMTENLKTTKYNDGTDIPVLSNQVQWSDGTIAALCWYNNNESANKDYYGALYNWYAVNSGRLCPTGWRVPTDDDWKILESYLGMSAATVELDSWRGTTEGTKMKSTVGWYSGGNGTNESGFTADPAGYRDTNGNFTELGINTYYWTSTSVDPTMSWFRGLSYIQSGVRRGWNIMNVGYSVRCIRN